LKLKVLLIAFLLLSVISVAVAANQLQNEKSIVPSETNGIINQPPNETNTEPLPNETNASSNDSIILEKVFNETFKLAMIIPKDTYALGEPVNITLRLTNLRNESVTIFHNLMSLLAYSVLDPSGNLIYYEDEVPGAITLPVVVDKTMEPNMAYEKLFVWRQVYWGTCNDVEYPITTPGTYTIKGRTYFLLGDVVGPLLEANLQVDIQII
jgi:hypothetical protein